MIFTSYLRSLDPAGEPPDEERFDALWQALRGALQAELRRRGLWLAPPSRLGVFGQQRWSEPGSPRGDDALDELVGDAYTLIFLDRIDSLRAHLLAKPNVDGLVFLNLRHFVSERQRRHDPRGARIFNVLRSAVLAALDERALFVAAGDPEVGNDTALAFLADTPAAAAASRAELSPHVERWCDDLLPGLFTTRGPGQRKLVAHVRSHVLALESQDVAAFAFRDLTSIFKGDARQRWQAVFEQAGGETAVESLDEEDLALIVRKVYPDEDFESRESFRRLVDCMGRQLRGRPVGERTTRELAAIWDLLLGWAVETAEGPTPELREETVPSRRKVAQLLDIPRDRLPALYGQLGAVLRTCRAAVTSPGYPGATVPASEPVGEMMSMDDRRTRLRRATGQAMARAARNEPAEQASAHAPWPGEVYILPATEDQPVEWVVLEDDPRRAGHLRIVPADTLASIGRNDVAVPAEEQGGPLVLRCAYTVTLPRTAFEGARCSRHLEPSYVELALRQGARLEEAGSAGIEAEELGLDPDYRDWLGQVSNAVRQVITTHAGTGRSDPGQRRGDPAPSFPAGERRPRRSGRRQRRPGLEALAAALAVTCLGLAILAVVQRNQLRRQGEPFFNPPPEEILLQDGFRDPPVTWTVPRDAQQLVLALTFIRPPPCEAFRIEIVNAGGHRLWVADELEATSGAYLELVVPRGFLDRRPAALRLFGRCRDATWTQLEERRLLVERQ